MVMSRWTGIFPWLLAASRLEPAHGHPPGHPEHHHRQNDFGPGTFDNRGTIQAAAGAADIVALMSHTQQWYGPYRSIRCILLGWWRRNGKRISFSAGVDVIKPAAPRLILNSGSGFPSESETALRFDSGLRNADVNGQLDADGTNLLELTGTTNAIGGI